MIGSLFNYRKRTYSFTENGVTYLLPYEYRKLLKNYFKGYNFGVIAEWYDLLTEAEKKKVTITRCS